MNDSSSGPLIVGLLFILRCLIPLGILFGFSYLLQRLGLVNDRAAEKKTTSPEGQDGNRFPGAKPPTVKAGTSIPAGSQKQGRKKAATPKTRSRNQ